MKTLRTLLICVVAFVLWSARPAEAQRLLDNTTLSANLTATATSVAVTSGSAAAVGEFVFVDAEVMRITAVVSNTLTVQRGQAGTRAAAHDNTETVFIVAGGDLKTFDPSYGADCTRGEGDAQVLPWINIRNANIWNCWPGVNYWNGTNTARLTHNSVQTGSP